MYAGCVSFGFSEFLQKQEDVMRYPWAAAAVHRWTYLRGHSRALVWAPHDRADVPVPRDRLPPPHIPCDFDPRIADKTFYR